MGETTDILFFDTFNEAVAAKDKRPGWLIGYSERRKQYGVFPKPQEPTPAAPRKRPERLVAAEREAELIVQAEQVRVSLEEFASDICRPLPELLKARGDERRGFDLLLLDLVSVHGRAPVRRATQYDRQQLNRALARARAATDSLVTA